MDERILYKKMKAGDINAFNQLFKLNYERLVRMLYKKCYNQALAEDIIQNVFIDFWTNKNKIEINNSVSAYLTTSTRNRYIDHFRKQKTDSKKEQAYINNSLTLKVSSPEDELLSKENLANIYAKIEALPFKSKAIFQLSRFENKSYPEIANELNISIKTVEYHISNALRILRKSIFFLFF